MYVLGIPTSFSTLSCADSVYPIGLANTVRHSKSVTCTLETKLNSSTDVGVFVSDLSFSVTSDAVVGGVIR